MRILSKVRSCLSNEWFCWKTAWDEMWREREEISRRRERVSIQLTELCRLLVAEDRARLYAIELVQARETIASLQRSIQQHQEYLDRVV
jgi:hypothetical protein